MTREGLRRLLIPNPQSLSPMRLAKKVDLTIPEMDRTPMIDVTFQLIIFFMLVINFSEGEQLEAIQLPLSELAKPSDKAFLIPPLTLQITRPDSAGKVFVHFGIDREIPLDAMGAIKSKLQTEKQYIEIQRKSLADATIIIRGDALARAGDVRKVIEACQDVGFINFTLRAKQDSQN